ncbi:MAG: recombination protein NinG [Proteocatella sp.]
MKKIYSRKCVMCKVKFTPQNNSQVVCSPNCAIEYLKVKRSKEWKDRKKELKSKIVTKSELLKACQIVFNTYIRLRDNGKTCISCDRFLTGKYDAGHFMSVGAYPNLRYDENNVHGQCVHCNQHKHGNVNEYAIKLKERIGLKKFDELQEKRNYPLKLSVNEIEEKMSIYKEKIKELRLTLNK